MRMPTDDERKKIVQAAQKRLDEFANGGCNSILTMTCAEVGDGYDIGCSCGASTDQLLIMLASLCKNRLQDKEACSPEIVFVAMKLEEILNSLLTIIEEPRFPEPEGHA